jgi:5-methylthioadenosine/S-adenosylhomocysteine deaminase
LLSVLQKERMKDASAISAETALNSATTVGYQALGFNGGKIAVGYDADMVLIDINRPNMIPHSNLKKQLVYSGDTSNVLMTIANGNVVYERGKFNVGESIEDIIKNVEKCKNQLIKRSEKA